MSERMFTVKEAAGYLGITRQSMYNIVKRGEIKYQKVGYIKIAEEDLSKYIKNEEGMMDVKEAAKYLGVHHQKMYKIIRSGGIETKYMRGKIMIAEKDLIEYRNDRTYEVKRSYEKIASSKDVLWDQDANNEYQTDPCDSGIIMDLR